jgi:hypothetical protein
VSIGVNERDSGTLYNTQLLFDADGALIQRRRKITPTYHERMVWGQGDGSGLRAVDSAVGRIGQLACWEHYNPLARYAMIADGEQIHAAMYPGSIFGDLFADQTEINIRQHALESACFVVCATAWLTADQQAQISKDTGGSVGPISGGVSQRSLPRMDACLASLCARAKASSSQTSTSRSSTTTVAELEHVVHGAIGSSGLMEFGRFDAGEVLRKEGGGQQAKLLRFLVGNPLIMKEMARRVPDAASYAPVTILVSERPDGVHLSFDSLASLLAPYGNEPALVVARDLDAKVESLLETAAGNVATR